MEAGGEKKKIKPLISCQEYSLLLFIFFFPPLTKKSKREGEKVDFVQHIPKVASERFQLVFLYSTNVILLCSYIIVS